MWSLKNDGETEATVEDEPPGEEQILELMRETFDAREAED